MKCFKNLFSFAAVAFSTLCCNVVFSQSSSGFDYVQTPRTILITPPKLVVGSTIWSNSPVDIHHFIGNAKIDIAVLTNGAAGATTITLYGSPDMTNWTALSSCMINSNVTTGIAYTNAVAYPTAIQTTNTMLLPGVITFPNAFTAGFSTPYLSYYPFTNSAVIAANAGGNFQIGFNADDSPRYLSLQYAGAATSTNFVAAFFTARLVGN